MAKRLYLVSSKYTLLNSLIIEINKISRNEAVSTLIVFSKSKEIIKIIDQAKEGRVFRKIILMPYINNWNRLLILKIFLWPKPFFKKYQLNLNDKFDNVFSQNILYASFLNRLYKFDKVNLIEDGLSSYTDLNSNIAHRSKLLILANRYIFSEELIPKIRNIYLHEPNMYKGNADIIQIPKIEAKNLNSLFNANKIFSKKYENKKYILLGTPLNTIHKLLEDKPKNMTLFRKSVSDIIEKVTESTKKSDLIYRLHPSEAKTYIHKNSHIDLGQDLWELVSCSIDQNHYLISFFSTAAITPKLIHGLEPKIVFLYKLLPSYNFVGADSFVIRLKNIYRNKEIIYTPESIKELRQILAMPHNP